MPYVIVDLSDRPRDGEREGRSRLRPCMRHYMQAMALRGRKEFVGCGWDIEGGMAMSAICCDQSTVRLYVL